jgi:F420-non-reducing hydrogenase large subunit
MAFRAYDPCFGCATHSLPGQMPLEVTIRDAAGNEVEVVKGLGIRDRPPAT